MKWLLTVVVNGIALLLVAAMLEGVHVDGLGSALLAAFILGLVNLVIRPLLILLTLPITLVTLGLFVFVINALTFSLTALMLKGFSVSGFGSALAGSLLMSLFSWLFHVLLLRNLRRFR